MADKVDDRGFLQRWSARKLDPRAEHEVAPLEVAPDEALPAEVSAEEDDAPPPDLPDIDTLDAQSDYTAFLGKNVPQDVTKLALRKLWRSDPALACLDGLNDYDEDFTKVGMASEVVKTLYKVGRGLMAPEDEAGLKTADEANLPADDLAEHGDRAPDSEPDSEPRDETILAADQEVASPSSDESNDEKFHNTEFTERD